MVRGNVRKITLIVLSFVFAVIMIFCGVLFVKGEENVLIVEDDMESIVSGNPITGFHGDWLVPLGTENLFVETENPINGEQSLGLQAGGSGWDEFFKVMVSGDMTYTVVMRYFTEGHLIDAWPQLIVDIDSSMATTTTRMVDGAVVEQKSNDAGYGEPQIEVTQEIQVGSTGIFCMKVVFTVPDSETSRSIRVAAAYGGKAYMMLDDFRIYAGEQDVQLPPIDTEKNPYEVGLLTKNDFESLTDGGAEGFGDFVAVDNSPANLVKVEDKDPINGKQSLVFTTSGGWNEIFRTSDDFASQLKGIEKYTVAFRIYTKSVGFPQLTIAIREKGKAEDLASITVHKTIDEIVEQKSSDESKYQKPTISVVKHDEYIDAAVEFNTTQLETEHVFLFAVSYDGMFVMDDLKIYEGNTLRWDKIQKPQEPVFYAAFENSEETKTQFTLNENATLVTEGAINGYSSLSFSGTDICALSTELNLVAVQKYTIGLRYAVGENEKICVNMGTYSALLTDAEDALESTFSETAVMDKGNYFEAYLTFTTPSEAESILFEIVSSGAATAYVDDIVIYKGGKTGFTLPDVEVFVSGSYKVLAAEDNFEGASVFTPSETESSFLKINEYELLINGMYSMQFTSTGEWATYCQTNPLALKLLPRSYYTILFRYSVLQEAATEFFVGIRNEEKVVAYQGINGTTAGQDATYTKFTDQADYTDATVTFYTGNEKDLFFVFGGKTTGEGYGTIILDDIRIFANNETSITDEDFLPVSKVDSNLDEGTLSTTMFSDYEDGNMLQTFVRTTGNGGTNCILVSNGNQINGKYSVQASITENDFRTYLFSDFNNYWFNASTWYTVQFRAKFIEPLAEGKIAYVIAKALGGGATYNISVLFKNGENGEVVFDQVENGAQYSITQEGDHSVVTMTFFTGDRDDYYLEFGGSGTHTLLLDDIRIFVGGLAAEYPTAPQLESRQLTAKEYEEKESYALLDEQIKISISNLFDNPDSIPLKLTCDSENVTFTTTSMIFNMTEAGTFTVSITAQAEDGGSEQASVTLTFVVVDESANDEDEGDGQEAQTGCGSSLLTENSLGKCVVILLLVVATLYVVKKTYSNKE